MTGPLGWLKANKHDLGMLTGQDRRALLAIAACWELYASADYLGQKAAVAGVRNLLEGMQLKCRPLAKELIAFALDWGDRDRLWAEVRP